MEKIANSLVFRRLTYADFRHINKTGGEEAGGGGQSYIDFPITNISLNNWFKFLGKKSGAGTGNRPYWSISINSLGMNAPINLKIFQRRAASVSIAAQKIHSRESNRVPAWHPANSFPIDYNPESDNLVVYIIKTGDGGYWAGWFLKNEIPKKWDINDELKRLFEEHAGYINFKNKTLIDTEEKDWPFYFVAKKAKNRIKTEDEIEEDFIDQDTSPKLDDLEKSDLKPEVKERIIKIRQRNYKIVKNLKKLYDGKCQLSDDIYTFKKKDGKFYSEVHHLIPLGEKGSDSYANAIVVSPLIHRMLHYAKVSNIDLSSCP